MTIFAILTILLAIWVGVLQNQVSKARQDFKALEKKVMGVLPEAQDRKLHALDQEIHGEGPAPVLDEEIRSRIRLFDATLQGVTAKVLKIENQLQNKALPTNPTTRPLPPSGGYHHPIPPPPKIFAADAPDVWDRVRAIARARIQGGCTKPSYTSPGEAALSWKPGTIFRDTKTGMIWYLLANKMPYAIYDGSLSSINRESKIPLYDFVGALEILASSEEVLGAKN